LTFKFKLSLFLLVHFNFIILENTFLNNIVIHLWY